MSSRIGRGFGAALMVLGGIGFLAGNPVGGMWWFLIGLFVRGAASASYQQLLVAEMFADQPVSRFMRREVVAVPPSMKIADWVEDYVHRQHYKMYPVVDDGELLGAIKIDCLRLLGPDERGRLTVRDLLEARSDANTVPPDTGTARLLDEIVRGKRPPRYMVADGTRLLGIISLKDLLELVAVRMDLGESRS